MPSRDDLLQWLKKHPEPGWYHNGGPNIFPTIEALVSRVDGFFNVTICLSIRGIMEEFQFSESDTL